MKRATIPVDGGNPPDHLRVYPRPVVMGDMADYMAEGGMPPSTVRSVVLKGPRPERVVAVRRLVGMAYVLGGLALGAATGATEGCRRVASRLVIPRAPLTGAGGGAAMLDMVCPSVMVPAATVGVGLLVLLSLWFGPPRQTDARGRPLPPPPLPPGSGSILCGARYMWAIQEFRNPVLHAQMAIQGVVVALVVMPLSGIGVAHEIAVGAALSAMAKLAYVLLDDANTAAVMARELDDALDTRSSTARTRYGVWVFAVCMHAMYWLVVIVHCELEKGQIDDRLSAGVVLIFAFQTMAPVLRWQHLRGVAHVRDYRSLCILLEIAESFTFICVAVVVLICYHR